MWSRQDLKQRAWNNLRQNYWPAFAVCLITGAVAGGSSMGGNFGNSGVKNSMSGMSGTAIIAVIVAVMAIMVFATIIGLVFSYFVTSPLKVGSAKFFVDSASGNTNMDNITYGFRNNYKNVAKSSFLVDLFIFLWSMLFVIPGIVKSYEYFMVRYIVAENPNIDYRRAFEISKMTTDGQKADMWILDLSFIGWWLLGGMVCIGGLFVAPYPAATHAQLYFALKEQALAKGYATEAEFGMSGNYGGNSYGGNQYGESPYGANPYSGNQYGENTNGVGQENQRQEDVNQYGESADSTNTDEMGDDSTNTDGE